jgi:CRP/FNR family cyclic AMP-dependent transcriptional regulator
VPIFQKLSEAELDKVEGIASKEQHKNGTVFFFEGDRADSLYLIMSGSVKVFRTAEDGRERIIGVVGTGDIFGELTLLDGRARAASVAALDDAEMISVAHRPFRQLLHRNPEVLWKVMESLCERIRSLNDETFNLAFEEAPAAC